MTRRLTNEDIEHLRSRIDNIAQETVDRLCDQALEANRRLLACAELRRLATELRERPWHLNPAKVAERIEALIDATTGGAELAQ